MQLSDLEERLKSKHIGLKVSPGAKTELAKLGYDPINGVRPLRRTIQEEVEDLIAEGMIAEKYKEGDIVEVIFKDKKLSFSLLSE